MKWENKELNEFYNHEFNFSNQHKTTYDDWLNAFEKAITKRLKGKLFMGMSSGYDSGAIAHELTRQNADVKIYSSYNNEDADVLDARLKNIPNHQVTEMTPELWHEYYNFLNGKVNEVAMKDYSTMGVAWMFETAKKEGRTICIAGQGGDETISDYALFPPQSFYKGIFPENLVEWPNFRGHMQLEYLNEIEDVAKIYGIEVRYPFLDVELAQEYLWLTADLKNKNYKAPIREYFLKYNVPFKENVKRGYRPVNKEQIGW